MKSAKRNRRHSRGVVHQSRLVGRREGISGFKIRTLIAQSTACVLLAIPTTTEPCLTASAAYSTWNILPCGELEVVSIRVGGPFSLGGSLQCDGIVIVIVSEHDVRWLSPKTRIRYREYRGGYIYARTDRSPVEGYGLS